MFITELLQSLPKLLHRLPCVADHNSEHILGEETLTWQHQHKLFSQQHLTELDTVLDVLEQTHVNLDHHVHGSLASDRFQSIDWL